MQPAKPQSFQSQSRVAVHPAWRKMPLAAALWLTLILPATSRAASPAEQPLAIADAAVAWRNQSEMSIVTTSHITRTDSGTVSHLGGEWAVKRFCDGPRLHVIIDAITTIFPSGAMEPAHFHWEKLFDPNREMAWRVLSDQPIANTVQLGNGSAKVARMRSLAEADSRCGAFLDGFIDGQARVTDLLRAMNAPIAITQDKWNGTDCQILSAQSPAIAIKIWIAPSLGSNIVKFTYDAKNDPDTGPTHWQFSAAAVKNWDGTPVISEGDMSGWFTEVHGTAIWRETIHAQRQTVEMHPSSGQPDIFTDHQVPQGARVFFDDYPNVGVDFVWLNGRPVPKVDPAMFDRLTPEVRRSLLDPTDNATLADPALANPLRDIAPSVIDAGAQRARQVWLLLLGTFTLGTVVLTLQLLRKRGIHAS
jgi:hypothetical protein